MRKWNLNFLISGTWLVFLVIGALVVRFEIFGGLNGMDIEHVFEPPGKLHWWGTDSLGRNLFSRVLQGCGTSLLIAGQSALLSVLVGMFYGGAAGWFGRWVDFFMNIFLEVWLSLPPSVFAAVLALMVLNQNQTIWSVGAIIGMTHWGRLARLVRGEVMSLRKKNYLLAAKSIGASDLQIFIQHLVPHLVPMIGIYVIYQIPYLILAESFLSFIGIGIQAPETSLGLLLQEGWRSLQLYPHVVFFPAMCLFLTILSLNFFWQNISESQS